MYGKPRFPKITVVYPTYWQRVFLKTEGRAFHASDMAKLLPLSLGLSCVRMAQGGGEFSFSLVHSRNPAL